MPLEPGGRRPGGRLVVHRRHNRAHAREVTCVGSGVGFTRNHIGEQFAFHPAREASPTPFSGRGDLDLGEVLARLRLQRFRRRDAGLNQRTGPQVLRAQGGDVVVPGPVQPQHERRSVARIDRAEGDVFAQIHEAQVRRLDAKRR